MEEDSLEHDSFINRKRPAMEGLIEDLLGPAALMDQVMGGKPDFPTRENEFEPDAEKLQKQEKNEEKSNV